MENELSDAVIANGVRVYRTSELKLKITTVVDFTSSLEINSSTPRVAR